MKIATSLFQQKTIVASSYTALVVSTSEVFTLFYFLNNAVYSLTDEIFHVLESEGGFVHRDLDIQEPFVIQFNAINKKIDKKNCD